MSEQLVVTTLISPELVAGPGAVPPRELRAMLGEQVYATALRKLAPPSPPDAQSTR